MGEDEEDCGKKVKVTDPTFPKFFQDFIALISLKTVFVIKIII